MFKNSEFFIKAYVEIEIESMKQVFGDPDKFGDWSKLKTKKINKTRKLVGPLIYHIDVDNSYLIESSVFRKQGGEYRLTPFKYPKKGFCDLIATDKYFFDDLAKNSNFSDPIRCPVLKVN